MAVLSSLRRTPSAPLTNPVLFVPVLIVMLFQVPQLALQSVNPFLSSIVSLGLSLVFIAVIPFFQGGLIGMADEALHGRTTLQRFIDDGKSNYVSILVGYLALMAINLVLGMIAFFVAIFGGVVLFQGGGLQSANSTLIVVIGGIVAVALLSYLLLVFFVQFYGQAIVLEELGVVDGFKRSVSVVRHHLVSTLGYSLIGAVVGGVVGMVFGAASIIISPQSTTAFNLPEPSLPIIAGMALAVIVGGTLFGGFFAVYTVSFYRAITR